MFEEMIFQKLWIVLPVWLALYVSDYYLTILGASYIKAGACEHFVFKGSYELTPVFQADINSLRLFSPKFTCYVFVSSVIIVILWFVSRAYPQFTFYQQIFVGGIILQEVAVLVRHIKNISLFHFAKNHRGISGQICYEKWLSYKISGIEFLSFACVYLVVFILTGSISFLGGSAFTASSGLQHLETCRKEIKKNSHILSKDKPEETAAK